MSGAAVLAAAVTSCPPRCLVLLEMTTADGDGSEECSMQMSRSSRRRRLLAVRWHLLKCWLLLQLCDRADSELVGKCQCVDINAEVVVVVEEVEDDEKWPKRKREKKGINVEVCAVEEVVEGSARDVDASSEIVVVVIEPVHHCQTL